MPSRRGGLRVGAYGVAGLLGLAGRMALAWTFPDGVSTPVGKLALAVSFLVREVLPPRRLPAGRLPAHGS